MKNDIKQLDYIDTIRGLAILSVILFHTRLGTAFSSDNLFGQVVSNGGVGVQLFYMASAFTLFMSFNNRVKSETFAIRNFFIRRIFRIAPMYYIGIIYYLFQNGTGWNYWLGDETHISFGNIFSNFLFLHGFNPYWINSLVPGGWSIAVEMTFYLLLPFIFQKVNNSNTALIFFIFTLLLKSILYFVFVNNPLVSDLRLWNEYLFFYFPNQLPVFALGILMYFCITESENNRSLNLSGKVLLILVFIILLQLVTGIKDLFLSNHILFGIAFLIFGIALSKYKPKLLVNPVVNYIGKLSFSMYLVHFAVLYWLKRFDLINYTENVELNYIIRFYIVVLITLAFSSLTYKLIEVPSQKIGKTLIGRMEKKAVCVVK